MNASAIERSESHELTWSLAPAEWKGENGLVERAMKLTYRVDAKEELYVGDRLWVYDASRKRVPDPYRVYRFVRDGSLRLVFAQAPWAPNVSPQVVFEPFFTRVRAGESREAEVLIKLPVEEYSSLARDVTAPSVLEEIGKVMLVMSYRTRASMDADPQPPPFETPDDPGYIVHGPKLSISEASLSAPIPVKRRTGYMARFALPGEPPPGLMSFEPPAQPTK